MLLLSDKDKYPDLALMRWRDFSKFFGFWASPAGRAPTTAIVNFDDR